jgi:ADP-heptose:LPS heptosyltransferase
VLYDPLIKAIHVEGGTRGASDIEKQSQSIHTRNWFIQEMKTKATFINWLKSVNMGEIDRRVHEDNLKPIQVDLPWLKFQKQNINKNVQLIGIRRSGALGDVMMATPIIRELKKRYPDSKIVFATQCPDALLNNEQVDQVVSSLNELLNMTPIVYDLDLAYENRPRMNIVDAYSEVVFGEQIEDKSLYLVSKQADFDRAILSVGTHVNFDRDKTVVIHQAVSWANRTWPKPYWDQVVQNLASRGYKVLIVGRGGDFQSDMIAGVVNLVNKLSVPQVREVIKRSKLFIGTDSGMLHVAQSTDTPIVGMFTVANPDYRITRKHKVTVMTPKSECRFCLHDEKPPVTFVGCRVGTLQCLKEITPTEVISSAIKMIQG